MKNKKHSFTDLALLTLLGLVFTAVFVLGGMLMEWIGQGIDNF